MCWFLCNADSITCVLLVWGVGISVEEKIAMCVTDVETFQTFLGPKLVIVKKLISLLLLKAINKNKNIQTREREKIQRKPS